jgi:predicted esterase
VLLRLYVPSGYLKAEKVPFILGLHGNGGTADSEPSNNDGLLFKEAERRGYIVACPTWPNKRIATGPTAENAAEMFVELIEQIRKDYPKVDPARLYGWGFSAGGWGACELAGTHPKLLAAICTSMGPGSVPQADKVLVPQLVIQGGSDGMIKPEYSEKVVARRKELGLPVEYVVIPKCGHQPHPTIVPLMMDFFDKQVKPYGAEGEGSHKIEWKTPASVPASRPSGEVKTWTGTASRSKTQHRPWLMVDGNKFEMKAADKAPDSVKQTLQRISDGDTSKYTVKGAEAQDDRGATIVVESITKA